MAALLLRAFGVLLVLTALALALSRAPDRSVESLVARWAPPPSEFIEMQGQLVHLRDVGPRGDAEPIVLIHGTSASLHTWDGWARALAPQRRVVTFDLPGFGLTGPFGGSYGRDDYRGATYARFVVDLLDHLKLARVVLGGNSLGGEVAWRVAVLAPGRVARLVLVDATGPPYTPESQPLGFTIARMPGLSRVTEWVLPRSLVAEGVAQVYGDPSKVTPELVDRYFELTLREGNRRALGHRMRQAERGEDAQRIREVQAPTLILWGGKDRLIPPAVAKEFERAIAGSRLVVFPELGHVPQEEDPAATVAELRTFLGLR
jgi:pimeloyl-ACP methyl ester carboxylesterase